MKNLAISGKVSQDLRILFNSSGDSELLENGLLFFPMGRDALLSGLLKLGVKSGDHIISPAFMCHSTIANLEALGFRIIYIDVTHDFQLDKVMLDHAIKKFEVKAILAVHYFGYSQDLKWLCKICNKKKIVLVQDCSHSFFSKIPKYDIDVQRHFMISSLRKSLPIKDGGVLKMISPNIKNNENFGARNWKVGEFSYILVRLLESIVLRIGWPNIYSDKIDKLKKLLRTKKNSNSKNSNFEFLFEMPNSVSRLTRKYLANKAYISNIKEKTVDNFKFLKVSIEDLGVEVAINELPLGSIPQYIVLRDSGGELVDYLRGKGVAAARWPGDDLPEAVRVNKANFPVTLEFNESLALLPVHASLSHHQCEKIVRQVKVWKSMQ